MLVVGIFLLLREARRFVDFSWFRLFAVPTLALGAGSLASRLAMMLPGMLQSDWISGAVKMGVFSILYAGILFALERANVTMLLSMLQQLRRIGETEG
jgi:hypothetical protein